MVLAAQDSCNKPSTSKFTTILLCMDVHVQCTINIKFYTHLSKVNVHVNTCKCISLYMYI